MFRSRAERGEGTSEPDSIDVNRLYDQDYDENWLRVAWNGDEYADAWIMDRMANVVDLDDNY